MRAYIHAVDRNANNAVFSALRILVCVSLLLLVPQLTYLFLMLFFKGKTKISE